jgi:hypothetical protein
MSKYSVNQHPISTLLNWVQSKDIAIPEIQRPFVWKTTKIRDLMDSLYKGYPIGYIIIWKNPDVKLKDGSKSEGKKVLIDGQQRITALRAAILGKEIIDKNYKEKRVKIAFHPGEEKFETLTPAIEKDKAWISDIAEFMESDSGIFDLFEDYYEKNPDLDKKMIQKSLKKLLDIKSKQVGLIELDASLDIETVTEIFIRINSEGVVLSQADFVMSKIASYEIDTDFGTNLRKCIDYFCHLAQAPEFHKQISNNDKKFAETEYFNKINWLKNENDDLYDPDYSDVLRVAFTKEFKRGKMSDLVSLLSGRDFETREFKRSIMEDSFERLNKGVLDFINETNFKRFLMIIKSSGFINKNLVRSKNVINFAYILFLTLKDQKFDSGKIEKYVQKWFIMSILTGRYSGSPESMYDYDIKRIHKDGIEKHLYFIENSELSDTFWDVGLVDQLDRAIVTSPLINVFFASQVKNNDKGFLSSDITVSNMIEHRGDIHHIFPRGYLKKYGKKRGEYNQIANYVYAQSEVNIKIGNKAPCDYMQEVLNQCEGGELKYGGIVNKKELNKNLEDHCIPKDIFEMNVNDYQSFLEKRRKLIANKIKDYYFGLSKDKEEEKAEHDYSDIIKNGENDYVEFKSSLRWDYENGNVNKKLEYVISKTIAAFMNSNGGKLFIGIDDSGKVLGVENDYKTVKNKNKDGFLLQLTQVINDYLGKEFHQYLIIDITQIDNKDVCVIEVLNSGKPVYVNNKEKNAQEFFVRSSASSQPMDIKEANEYIKSHWANM